VDAWLTATRDAVAAKANTDATSLELTDDDTRTLLDIARVAAHESGDRTNAPLLCYLMGMAVARGAELDVLANTVRRSSS
jgi:hypothetical protein